jgi:hypothetical protein
LSKGHGASCRLAVPFSSAQRRVGFRLRRLRAQFGPLHQTRERMQTPKHLHAPKRLEQACRQAEPLSGCWGPPDSGAPKRLGFQPRRRHLPRSCARRNHPRCRETQRCSRFVRAVRALGSSSARLRNAAHCQGLPRAEARLVPCSRLVARNASSPVIAERRRSIRRSSRRSLEPDSST